MSTHDDRIYEVTEALIKTLSELQIEHAEELDRRAADCATTVERSSVMLAALNVLGLHVHNLADQARNESLTSSDLGNVRRAFIQHAHELTHDAKQLAKEATRAGKRRMKGDTDGPRSKA